MRKLNEPGAGDYFMAAIVVVGLAFIYFLIRY
ncbi:hypothetical protein [Staphylococcus phage SpP]